MMPGQFTDDGVDDPNGIGRQHLYDRVGTRIYYSASSDTTPATISDVSGERTGSTASVTAAVADDSTVKRVIALVDPGTVGSDWTRVEMHVVGGLWFRRRPSGPPVPGSSSKRLTDRGQRRRQFPRRAAATRSVLRPDARASRRTSRIAGHRAGDRRLGRARQRRRPEGNTGAVVVNVPVTLSAGSTSTVTVHYATLDTGAAGIATSGVDYLATSGTLFLSRRRDVSKAVPIAVEERLGRRARPSTGSGPCSAFSSPVGASLDTTFFGLGVGIILDDDRGQPRHHARCRRSDRGQLRIGHADRPGHAGRPIGRPGRQ